MTTPDEYARQVTDRETSLRAEILHNQTFAEKYLQEATCRPVKSKEAIDKVVNLVEDLKKD